MQCGAKTRGGGTCKGKPMENGRCRMHGGGSLRGVAHPGYVDGARSRYRLAPGALGSDYTANLVDADYIALRDELALVTAQLQGLFEEAAQEPSEVCGRCVKISQEERFASLVELRRKLADTEAKRVKMAQDTLTGEQIGAFAQAVLEANRRRADQYIPREKVASFISDVQQDVRSIVLTIKGGS